MRYLAIDWSVDPNASDRGKRVAEMAIAQFGLRKYLEAATLIVLADPDIPNVIISPNHGLVIGSLFTKDDRSCRVQRFDDRDARRVLESNGLGLITDYWGGYVAFVAEDQSATTHIMRDPSGAVPCYRLSNQGLNVFFSDVEVPLGLGLIERRLDWTYLAHHLAFYALRPVRTAAVGIDELLAGSQMRLGGFGADIRSCWTPWTFAGREHQIEDRALAVEMVEATTRRCVTAWGSCWDNILLELSGGLDSSIIAAALEGCGNINAVTMVTPDPGADERRYAKLVSDRFGIILREAHLSADDADLSQYPRQLLPRPGIGALQQVVDRIMSQNAVALGADCFFSGGGGDNVFCYLSSAAPAADLLRTRGPGKAFFRAVGDLSTMHGCTVWKAGKLAIRKARRESQQQWKCQREFLLRDSVPAEPDGHHWLILPDDALPGKFEHIVSLIRAQIVADAAERSRLWSICYPLLSQPLVELCLRIPTWMWILEGRNRAIARDAFAGSLPPEILGSKPNQPLENWRLP